MIVLVVVIVSAIVVVSAVAIFRAIMLPIVPVPVALNNNLSFGPFADHRNIAVSLV